MRLGLFAGRVGLVWLFISILAAELDAQLVYGRVIDAQSNEGVPRALVEVLQNAVVVARSAADSTGAYRIPLPIRQPGSYQLRASRVGFVTQDSPPLDVGATDIVELNLRISPSPLPLEELMVEISRNNLRHAATHEGLHARRARASQVGQERVVIAGDPELERVSRVQDVVNLFFFGMTNSRTRCTDFYVNGVRRDESVLDIPADMVEGVEYYVDGRFAPFGFMGGRCSIGLRFSVVAVWLRRPFVASLRDLDLRPTAAIG
jgi:hypothetical protein